MYINIKAAIIAAFMFYCFFANLSIVFTFCNFLYYFAAKCW